MTDHRMLTALQETGKATVIQSPFADLLDDLVGLGVHLRDVLVTGTLQVTPRSYKTADQVRLDAADATWTASTRRTETAVVDHTHVSAHQEQLNKLCEQLLDRGYSVVIDFNDQHRRVSLYQDGTELAMALIPTGDFQHWPDPADKMRHVLRGLTGALDLDLPGTP